MAPVQGSKHGEKGRTVRPQVTDVCAPPRGFNSGLVPGGNKSVTSHHPDATIVNILVYLHPVLFFSELFTNYCP